MNVARKTYKEGAKIMGKRLCLPISILAMALQLAVTAQAATLWDNGAPNITNLGGSEMSDTFQAEDFNVAVASDLTGIRFWDLESSPADYNGSIFWRIVNNLGVTPAGSPGTTVFDSGTATPARVAAGTVLGFNQFQNDFSVSTSNLLAGTYWLELHNGPLASNAFTDFYWSYTDLDGTNTPTNRGSEFALPANGFGWTTNDQEHAFEVFGAPHQPPPPPLPEPGTMALMAAGIAVLTLRRRRKG